MHSLTSKIVLYEKRAIEKALHEYGWVKARAAKILGITERMIGYKIKNMKLRGR